MTKAGVTATETVVGSLRSMLTSGVLVPGQQFIQEDLAENLGVSRVPIREALKILEGEGLVTYHPNRGYFVTELSAADLVELYRIREILESEALAIAVTEVSDADIEAIESILENVTSAAERGDVTSLTALNRAFHFAIVELSGNHRLSRLIRQLWDASDIYRTVYFRDPVNRERITAEHQLIIDALRARDASALISAHNLHRHHAVKALQTVINAS
ncbi:MAG: GntR family transcriptional regulator [Candidatus Nanopelagicales bacterium]|nr:GntR family transcriptional regulator [Candidatus Nanopelagicales bacterium]MCF8551146.1 GntR family transcriptional regulator [Candidatus Nanopelagicales bacterium]